jgi:hypothetical protein
MHPLDFGDALRAMKTGSRVRREGWNGRGMYVWMRPAIGDDEPYLAMHTAQGVTQPGWLASQADMLAEDWVIV